MKLSCLQENLNWGLGIVKRAVAIRNTLPITNNILLETDGPRLKLVATDLEKSICCWIDAKVEEEGAITLPTDLLITFVSSLKNDTVDVVMTPKTRSVSIKCVRDRAVINGLDARDFPPIPNVAKGISATIEITALRQAITQVVFAASSIEARPILTGVEARLEGSTLALAAADGFRLAVYKFTLSQPVDQKVTAIIPAKTLIELNTLMKDQTEPISVTISKSHIIFRLKDIELVSTLINGEFPQYEQLYPQGSSTKVIVNTVKFLQVTKAAAVFARENSNIVRMIITPGGELTPGKLTLLAKANDIGDNQGEIDATVQGGEVKVVFTSRYMSDVLGVLKNAQVSVEIFGSTSPIVIRAVGDENYIHLIMPMFAVWE